MAALDGILVADFTRVLAGPYATMLMADLGARVIKVERPGSGDDTRAWGPPYAADGQATYFQAINRNKASVTLDLADPADLALARELCDRADVVIHNFRVGAMERRGLGYEDLRSSNPGLVYCAISGFGSGAGAELPGYDLLVQAVGGLMDITGEPGAPTKVGVAIVDVVTGLHAAVGVLAALHARQVTGVGQAVEVTLLGSLLSSLVNQASAFVGAGVSPTALGNAHPSIAPYEPLPTADRPLVVAVGNDGQFRRLCAVLDHPEWAQDDRFSTNPARVAHRPDLVALLAEVLATRGADVWQAELTAAGVPCGPINTVAEAFSLADGLGLAAAVEFDPPADVRTTANPIAMSATPAAYRSPSPALGAQDAEVRAWLAAPTGADA